MLSESENAQGDRKTVAGDSLAALLGSDLGSLLDLTELCGTAGSSDCGPQGFVDDLIRLAPLRAVRLCLAGASCSFVSMAEPVEPAAALSPESAEGLDTAAWWADRQDAVCQQVRAVEVGSQPSSVRHATFCCRKKSN